MHGCPAEQEVAVEARDAPRPQRAQEPAVGGGARHGRGASPPPHQPQRLLSRQEGRHDQGRRIGVTPAAMPVTVAIDAMGGDHGPSITLLAALSMAN